MALVGCAIEGQSAPSSRQPVVEAKRSPPADSAGEPKETERRPSISLGYAGDGVLGGGGVARDIPLVVTGGARTYAGAPPYFSREMDTYVPPGGRGGGAYPYSWRGRECSRCRR